MAETARWEYRVQSLGSAWHAPKEEALQEAMNALGEEGWEVFSVAMVANSLKVRISAKRPLSGRASRLSAWPG